MTYMVHSKYCLLFLLFTLGLLACDEATQDTPNNNFDVVINASSTQINAPASVIFSSRSNGPLDGNYLYVWDFGDGTGSEEAEPEHTYNTAGTYTVTLNLTESDSGMSAEATVDIEVLSAVALVASNVSFAPMVTLKSGDELSITWQLQQSGGVALQPWRTETFLLKAQEDGSAPNVTAMNWSSVNGKVNLVPFVETDNEEGTRYLEQKVVIPDGITSGDYYVGIYVDSENTLQETSRDDNIAMSMIAIRVRNQLDTGPDLSTCGLEILSFADTEVGQRPIIPLGEQIEIELCFSNLGDRPVLEIPYRLYLSSDNDIDEQDVLLDLATESALGSEERSRKTITVDLPLELMPQTYRLILQVDPEDLVDEQDEDNNQRLGSIAFDVVEPGEVEGVDLVMGAATFDQELAYWGQRLEGSFVLSHRGSVDVNRFFVVRFSAVSTDGMTRIALPSVNLTGIEAGSDVEQEFALNITRQIPAGEYRIEIEVDPTNSTNDVNPGNNSRTSSQILRLGGEAIFDPSVQSIALGTTQVDAGSELQVSTQIKNLGETATSAFEVVFYLSSDEAITQEDLVLGTTMVDRLEGGEVLDLEESFVIPLSLDQQVNPWYVAVYIDPMQTLMGEESTDNNLRFAVDSLQVEGATGGCSEDEYENNNVVTNAIPLSAGSYDNLGMCDDADWFSTDINANEILKLSLSWTALEEGDNVAPSLGLARADGSIARLAEWKGDFLSLWVSADEASVGSQVRYQITGDDTRFQYDLQVEVASVSMDSEASVGQVEVLPSIAQANTPLQLSWVIRNFGVNDWQSQEITIYLFDQITAGADPVATLSTVQAPNVSGQSSVSMTERTQLPNQLADGLYYIVVSLGDGLDTNVQYWASTLIRVDSEQACNADPFEPNGSPYELNGLTQQAATLTAGVYDDLYTCVGDDDWYRVTLEAGEALNATINFTHSNGDLDLALYDIDGRTLISESTSLQNQESVELFRSSEGGEYLVRVYLGIGDQLNVSNRYQLTLEVGPSQSCGDDGFEPNASAEEAALMSDGLHELVVCPGGEDWFRFNVPAGNTVSYDLFAGAGTVELTLFDPDDRLLESNSQRITHEASITGTYRLRVRGLSMNEPADYILDVNGVSGVDLSIDDIVLTNNEIGIGDEFLARVDVSNLRGDTVQNVTIAFTLSSDLRATDDDLLLTVRTIDEIQGAATLILRERLRIPSQAIVGDQYLLVEIDPNRLLPDIRPSNNVRTTDFNVLASCVDDDDRNNEGPSTATELDSLMSTDYEGVICPYTEDWYAWNATEGEHILTVESDALVDVRVYRAEDQSLVAESLDVNGTEVLNFTLDEADRLFIQVDGFFDARANYSLNWE